MLKKSKKDNEVLFIDASAEFAHVGNKNKLAEANQQKILDAFTAREDIKHFAKLVPNADLAENGYNIAVSSYVEAEDTSEAVDIAKLNADIAEIVARQSELRTAIDAIVRRPGRRRQCGCLTCCLRHPTPQRLKWRDFSELAESAGDSTRRFASVRLRSISSAGSAATFVPSCRGTNYRA